MASINMISVLIMMCFCLINISQQVHSKVVTVNNIGNNSATCCTKGTCLCNSLYDALQSIEDNTIINITSESVLLEANVYIGVEYLNNITITGNEVTVMCNNKGAMFWRSGDNILIEGITWDQCGNPRNPLTAAINFQKVFQISIIKCTFQHCKICQTISLWSAIKQNISVHVESSRFMYNKVENASFCIGNRGTIVIRDYDNPFTTDIRTKNAEIVISGSIFYSNGNQGQPKHEDVLVGVLFCFLNSPLTLKILIEHSNFSSNGLPGMYLRDNADNSYIAFNNVTVFNNSQGGVEIGSGNGNMVLDIISSHFIDNNNGALVIDINKIAEVNFKENVFAMNIGTRDSQGTALYIMANNVITISIFHCRFDNNTALGGYSIVYIASNERVLIVEPKVVVIVNSSIFVNNQIGSAMYVSHLMLTFDSYALFQNNSAETGAAIYADHNSIITAIGKSELQFINNSALLRGGAIYSDLSNCFNNGILFSSLSNSSLVEFIKNTATISGNSIYLNIPTSCNVERDHTKSNSVAYILYKFKYTHSHNTIGAAISTSPYRIKLCSLHNCGFEDETCLITEKKMLGQSIYFNATMCDYFNAVAEAVQFRIKCINCDTKYRLLNNELLINNRSPNKIEVLATNANNDVINDTNITLELSSVLSGNLAELVGRLSLTISSCYNGFLFSSISQKCECYSNDDYGIVQCQEDHAEIKLGYWYGIIFQKHWTVLSCPINYCDFHYRVETRRDYYILPKAIDDQCNSHRTGVVCSDCKPGYALAYDSFDCVNVNQCSPGMTVLVIGLTFLYWIIVVITLFVFTYYFSNQVSSGYFTGIIYFYSTVDILLASKLYIIGGLFYTVTILSSFAKLTPQFLGRLCIVKGLDAIDQQFIHYSHILCISFILIGIVFAARCLKKLSFYINRCITHVTYLFIILSYTSVASTSLQLLRGVQYTDDDDIVVYLSPHFKYFTQRHAVYATVALLCGLVMIVGLPVLLIIEPFLEKVDIKRINPLLNCFQDGYKHKRQWFSGYYFLGRLVIMLIAYFGNSNHNNMVYYMQTACVIIAINHISLQPYKKQMLNVLDAAILLTMLLTVNLNNFDFSEHTTAILIYILLFIPLILLCGIGFRKLLSILYMIYEKFNDTTNSHTAHTNRR